MSLIILINVYLVKEYVVSLRFQREYKNVKINLLIEAKVLYNSRNYLSGLFVEIKFNSIDK